MLPKATQIHGLLGNLEGSPIVAQALARLARGNPHESHDKDCAHRQRRVGDVVASTATPRRCNTKDVLVCIEESCPSGARGLEARTAASVCRSAPPRPSTSAGWHGRGSRRPAPRGRRARDGQRGKRGRRGQSRHDRRDRTDWAPGRRRSNRSNRSRNGSSWNRQFRQLHLADA